MRQTENRCLFRLEFAQRTELVQLHGLLGADDAGHHFLADIGKTWQAATLTDCVVEQFAVLVLDTVWPAFRSSIQTYILAGGGVGRVSRCQVSLVLGRPARGTGEGTGHHDGAGLGDPAHGAGDVVVVQFANYFIL